MFFFKGKEDMGLDASLSLLDLSSNATIDEANQAYTYLHRMIDLFHRDNEAEHGDQQEDLELLACAYEKAVSYLSDKGSTMDRDRIPDDSGEIAGDTRSATDLHFTINFSDTGDDDHPPATDSRSLGESDDETVENAIAIISRRLHEAESALTDAREAVAAATAVVDTANQRLEAARQARINAVIAAKSAKSRALLMDIEAKRTTEEALAIAEKARDRVTAARQAAKAAEIEADRAEDQISQVMRAEETAAAEAVCAGDALEKAKQRLETVTHAVVEARSQLRVFEDYGETSLRFSAVTDHRHPKALSAGPLISSQMAESQADAREQIMSDLLQIEDFINDRKQQVEPAMPDRPKMADRLDQEGERRQHKRLYYPNEQRPMFAFNGRTIPVLDLSQTGMGLVPDAAVGQAHLVRGAIVFNGLPTVNVAGKVVRRDDQALGLHLVTRIGNHILDKERMRLGA